MSLSSVVVWDQVPKLHLSNSRAPKFPPTIYSLVWRISGNLDSLATNSLERLLVGFCHLELDGGEVALTLRVLLAEMLGSTVLLVL